MRLKENHFKHFLIQTFSYLLMRELEFSCGYPTASLKERLYISNTEQNMSGVLIYTAEGAEGSMGGLVSQGEPDKINEILKKSLQPRPHMLRRPAMLGIRRTRHPRPQPCRLLLLLLSLRNRLRRNEPRPRPPGISR